MNLINAHNEIVDNGEVVDVFLKRGRMDRDVDEDKETKRRSKGKEKMDERMEDEAETSKANRRRKRHLGVQDFALAHGQEPYSVLKDLGNQNANITYGQLVALVPSLRRDLRSGINTRRRKKNTHAHLVEVEVDVICNGTHVKSVLIDGGATVNVISEDLLKVLGLKIDRKSQVTLGMANKA